MRNRECGHCERKEVNARSSNLKEEELLDLSEREAGVFIDERLRSSAEFEVAATAWLARCSVYYDKTCRKATCQRFLLSPRDRAVAPPPL
jgi:hypothetical protein